MNRHGIFEAEHWLVSHRQDARYPGYLMVSSREQKSDLCELDAGALQELGFVLKSTEQLLHSLYAPCKVIFYKLGFSGGFSFHFHVAPVTPELLAEIMAHAEFTDEPDGNDAILFLSRIYCERPLTDDESVAMDLAVEKIRTAANSILKSDPLRESA